MRAGDLIHRITIQQPTETQGAKGQPVRSWTTLRAKIAASVEELSGVELFNAQQTQPDITHRVTIYWCPGVTTLCKVIYHDGGTDRELNILVPPTNPDRRRVWLHLMCKEPK